MDDDISSNINQHHPQEMVVHIFIYISCTICTISKMSKVAYV